MPVYEYVCPACRLHFERMRPMREADSQTACPACETEALRKLSRFALKRSSAASESDDVLPASTTRSHVSGCRCCP